MRKYLHIIALIFISLPLSAQVTVEARIDSIEMLVGQQVHVTVDATMKEGSTAVFPVYQPTQQLIPGIEVLASMDQGARSIENGYVKRSVIYTLTSFDDTLYYLPPFVVNVDGKPYESKSLALKVLTVEVDTLHPENFYPPKDAQDNPFLWSDWSLSFWLSVAMLLLMAIGYYLYLRLRDNKPIIKTIKLVKRLLPHQRAMKEIEQIKAEKMVIAEDSKEYYTKLTDTLRRYIEERYGFSAMEMTSSEIIDNLTRHGDQQSLEELRQLFTTADLVKFAKYSTLINENDANLVNAIDFINKTKVEVQQQDEPQKLVLTEEEQRSQKERRVLKSVIIAISVACVGMLAYIVYSVYQLLI